MGSQQQSAPPPQQHSFSGFLFDMDGTIIDSTTAIVKHWHRQALPSHPRCPLPLELTKAHSIGKEIGVSGQTILETSHGRRSIDVFKVVAPHKATWECRFLLCGAPGESASRGSHHPPAHLHPVPLRRCPGAVDGRS